MRSLLALPLIALVRFYQWFISPVLPRSCRFTPTCSQYSIEALRRFGPIKGSWLAARRVTRCHPGNIGGWDPVPNLDGSKPFMINTTPHINDGLKRLNEVLPLAARQADLDDRLRGLHRLVLNSLAREGRLPTDEEMSAVIDSDRLTESLKTLAALDLIVLKEGQLVGAYPVTTEQTKHEVRLFGHRIYAMCALDAVSVASLFDTDTIIDSRCAVTGEAIHIEQTNLTLLRVEPRSPMVGIRWQDTCGHAAHSLCMDMLYLKDEATAETWCAEDSDNRSIYQLDEAVIFGHRFFSPLMADS